MNFFSRTLMMAYMALALSFSPLTKNLFGQDSTRTIRLKDPAGAFYTWEKSFPDTTLDLGEIGIFPKLPSSDAYPDNLSAIVDQLAAYDSTNTRWATTPIPVSYGDNTSSGVDFDSLARTIGQDLNLNVGRNLLSEAGVTTYGILFQYADTNSLAVQRNPDGTPQLAVITLEKDLYNPQNTIAGLLAQSLGFSQSLDRTSVSGNGTSFSPIDYQMLSTWFNHPVGYDFRPSWGDSSRGDVETPVMVLSAPDQAAAGTPVTLDASASTDNVGIEEFAWDFDFNGYFDPDSITASGTIDKIFSDPTPSDRTVMVVGKDANNNQDYAEKNINIIASPTAPVFDGYHFIFNRVGLSLSVRCYFSDPTNPSPSFTHTIISTSFPNLAINPNNGVIFSTDFMPDSLAGKAYHAIVAASNGSETTSERVDWNINNYDHEFIIDYRKDGVNQAPLQFNGSDRTTNYMRNASTSPNIYIYNSTINPIEFEEIKDRLLNRPVFVELDLTNYNFSTNPSWINTEAKTDSILDGKGGYQTMAITIYTTDN